MGDNRCTNQQTKDIESLQTLPSKTSNAILDSVFLPEKNSRRFHTYFKKVLKIIPYFTLNSKSSNTILDSVFLPELFSQTNTRILQIWSSCPWSSISRCLPCWALQGTGSLANAVCCPFFQAKNRLQATGGNFLEENGKKHRKHLQFCSFLLEYERLMVKIKSYLNYFYTL